MAKKKEDGRKIGSQTGNQLKQYSDDYVQRLMKKYGLSSLEKVDNLEFKNIIEQTTARNISFLLDLQNKKELVEIARSVGLDVLKEEGDLLDLKSKVSELEKNVQFHKKVLKDLKEQYMQTQNPDILEQIDEREEQILKFNRLINQTKELQNKLMKNIINRKKEQNKAENKDKDKFVIDYSIIDKDE
ncbi:MAG: hypothetical protein ACQESN_11400 [Thermotogota bacterium]